MMVHESVLAAIHDDFDSDVEDDDDGYEDEDKGEDNGELQSGFRAMDITGSNPEEENLNRGGEPSLAEATTTEARIREFEPGKSSPKKKTKKKKKRKQKGQGNQGNQGAPNRRRQPMSIEQFVVQSCRRIGETKYPLFREAVDRIGIDAVKALLNQVDVVEKCGGQMTADGLRRRSAGGVLWSLLRDHVGPELYKEIMKEGNRKHIEQQKAKLKERENERGNGKRQYDDRDERQNVKRRRTSMDVDDRPPARSVSRERLPRASLRDEVDNVRAPAALQNAWIQGLKRHALNPKPLEEKAPNPKGPNPKGIHRPVSERVRVTVSYGDLVEGEIAFGAEEEDCKGHFSQELEEMQEEGEIIG